MHKLGVSCLLPLKLGTEVLIYTDILQKVNNECFQNHIKRFNTRPVYRLPFKGNIFVQRYTLIPNRKHRSVLLHTSTMFVAVKLKLSPELATVYA